MTNVNTRTTTPAATSTGGNGFFNFHASGVGWMNRVRLVAPKRGGKPFLACGISALHGAVDAPERTCLDLRVSGGEAQKLVKAIQKRLEKKEDAKVFVSFKAGDLYPHVYERMNRETKRQETTALIKGRLLTLTSITIDGEKVWPKEAPEAKEETPAAPAPEKQAQKPAPEADAEEETFADSAPAEAAEEEAEAVF